MKKYISISIILLTLLGCGGNSGELAKSEQKSESKSDGITAKEISDAFGMHRVTIQIPEGVNDLPYGFTIVHKDGVLPMGFGKYKPGSKLCLLYWPDGNSLKYSIQGDVSSSSGSLKVSKNEIYWLKSGPIGNEVYVPGQIFEKWTVNLQMDSTGKVETIINGGEVGLCFIQKKDDLKFSELDIHPVEEVKPGF